MFSTYIREEEDCEQLEAPLQFKTPGQKKMDKN
jgi:hypothetical protein